MFEFVPVLELRLVFEFVPVLGLLFEFVLGLVLELVLELVLQLFEVVPVLVYWTVYSTELVGLDQSPGLLPRPLGVHRNTAVHPLRCHVR